MATYIALIRKHEGSAFGVDFPDFPGCISAGDTLDEALRGAREALALHVKGMLEDGDSIPPASPLDAILENPDHHDGAPCVIQLPELKGRAVRVNITIEENLLRSVDGHAAQLGTSRSGYVAEALRAKLGG